MMRDQIIWLPAFYSKNNKSFEEDSSEDDHIGKHLLWYFVQSNYESEGHILRTDLN